MPKYRVVTPKGASFTVAGSDYSYEREALDPIDAEIVEAPASEAEFIAAAKTADAIYAKAIPITKSIIDALESCKVITLGSVGVDSVDIKAATARGIPVTNIPDTFIEEVADHAMMLLLAGFRRLVEQDRMVRSGRWAEGRPALLKIPRLMGQTLGFVSFGRVARAVAKRAAPFGLRMMAYDPFIQETLMSDHGVIPATLNEVLSQSDFVSMHAPARPEVHHMLTEKHFRQMKKGSIFINTGRGATVDEDSLIKALQEGWIAHAALDVLEKEPPSHNNPLLGMENVTLTAHVASASARFDEARKRRVGYELSLVLSGHVAGKLRQPVGAAEHRAPPLAARQHGSRAEQLGGRRRTRPKRNDPSSAINAGRGDITGRN
ncbi:D-3-phosphoglycerate dehydrogenase [Bradyrhizobium sp. LM2.7]